MSRRIDLNVCLCAFVQTYDQELFKMAMPCLSAIAGALPPDYIDPSLSTALEKHESVDAQGNFDPRPINTAKYERVRERVWESERD